MKASTRYVKIVEWSDEDQLLCRKLPGSFFGGCHGDNEEGVFVELCELVEETLSERAVASCDSGKDYANKMLKIA